MQNISDRARQYGLMWDYFGRFPAEEEIIDQLNQITIKMSKRRLMNGFKSQHQYYLMQKIIRIDDKLHALR